MDQEIILNTKKQQNNIKDVYSLFFSDYQFFSIKNSKTPLYAILNTNTGKIYLKGKIGFIDDVYYMMKDEKYMEGSTTLLELIIFSSEKKSSARSTVSTFLDENDKIKIIDDVIFKPVEERIIKQDEFVFLNQYTPTKYLKKSFNNGNTDETKFKHIKYLLMNICANDKGAYEYLLKVLSLSIRKPWIKRHGYIIFQGEGASGKGSFFDLIMDPIFQEYCLVDTEEVLRTNFNGYSSNILWVFIEEKDDTNNRTKGGVSSTLKYLTGNKKSVSESKGIDRKVVEDYRNFGMTTNKTTNVGLNLEKSDRRATIFGFSRALGGSDEKAPLYRLKFEKEIPKELDDFVSYLKNMEYDEKEVFTSYKNEARQNLVEMDMTNTDLFIEDIKSYENGIFENLIKDYNFCENLSNEIELDENKKKYNINIYFTDKSNKQEFYILLNTIYDLFKRYCENNGKHALGYNKFSTEFSYNTKIKSIFRYIKNQKKKVIKMKDFLKCFNLNMDEKSDIYNFIEVKSK